MLAAILIPQNSAAAAPPITGTTAFILRAKQRVYILPAHPRAQP